MAAEPARRARGGIYSELAGRKRQSCLDKRFA